MSNTLPLAGGSFLAPVLSLTGTPPDAVVGKGYFFRPQPAGGATGRALTFSLTAGALPDGLTFSTHTGTIRGSATTAGITSGLTISVTDGFSTATLGPLSLTVAASAGGGGVEDPAATALLARMTTASPARKTQINAAITKASAVIPKLDYLHMLNAEDEAQAALNWAQNAFNVTKVGTPAFSAGRGYKGNGTSQALAIGFTPSTAGGKMLQDSATIGVTMLDLTTASDVVHGGDNGIYLGHQAGGAELKAGVSSTGSRVAGQGGAFGIAGTYTLVRRSATAVDVYCGRNKLGTVANNSSGLAANALRYLAGTSSLFSPTAVAAGFAGSALTDAEVAALADAIHADMVATGAYVYPHSVQTFGDSRIQANTAPLDPVTESIAAKLQALYVADGSAARTIKTGFPGAQIATLSGYLDTDANVRSALQFAAPKRVIFFWEVVNSILNNVSASACFDQTQAICAKIRTHQAAGDKIIVCTEIAGAPAYQATVNAFNAALRAGFASFADGLIDLAAQPEFADNTNTTYYNADGLHVTAASNGIIAALLKTKVAQLV